MSKEDYKEHCKKMFEEFLNSYIDKALLKIRFPALEYYCKSLKEIGLICLSKDIIPTSSCIVRLEDLISKRDLRAIINEVIEFKKLIKNS